jgi:hypothetical protein
MDTTGKALVEHWNWAAEKGVMNKNTALGIRAAVTQVLSVVENWQDVDVMTLDVDDTFARFQNLKGREFKPEVLRTYQQRWRQAVVLFKKYVEDPSGWRPGAPRAPRATNGNGGSKSNGATTKAATVETVVQPLPATNLVEYPYPLRENQTVRLVLPRDLKSSEVKRLAAFMNTLTADFEATA